MISEKNFIDELKKHNEDALEFVIKRYGNLLKAEIRKTLYSYPDEQEDCLYDVFMKIWEHIDSFDETRSSFPNWAVALSRYRAIDYLRKHANKNEVSLDGLLENGDEVLTEVEDKSSDFVEEMEKESEFQDELNKLLSSLSPADRELFIKYYIDEISMEELAESTGKSKDYIYNRLSRGRKKIRERRNRDG
ncbi:MAG: sigma-70 family RNA polymerase sigma factor [Eubacterium sp.]|nr:sigma-70 family RNA polymerase sigma factor [Eubacterium sp.]